MYDVLVLEIRSGGVTIYRFAQGKILEKNNKLYIMDSCNTSTKGKYIEYIFQYYEQPIFIILINMNA